MAEFKINFRFIPYEQARGNGGKKNLPEEETLKGIRLKRKPIIII